METLAQEVIIITSVSIGLIIFVVALHYWSEWADRGKWYRWLTFLLPAIISALYLLMK